MKRPTTVLLDLSGTLHAGNTAIPGAIDAVARLRTAGIAVRAVSNTSRQTRKQLHQLLLGLGFDFARDEIFTAPIAARRWLEQQCKRPLLLVHPQLLPEFDGIDTHEPDAVVVADAGDGFQYQSLNAAFRLLLAGAAFIATGTNRYFRDGNQLSLDAGPFVRALEYASGREATVVGKPSRAFFQSVLDDAACAADAAVMIGDDVENDVHAARQAGLNAILVRTGKYRAGDETGMATEHCVADIVEAVDAMLAS